MRGWRRKGRGARPSSVMPASADGESPRVGRRHGGDAGGWLRRDRRRAADVGRLPTRPRMTVGGEKAYDARDSSASVGTWASRRTSRRKTCQSAIDAPHDAPCRATRSVSGAANEWKRVFGWMKTTGLLRKLRHRGGPLVDWIFTFTAAACRINTVSAAPADRSARATARGAGTRTTSTIESASFYLLDNLLGPWPDTRAKRAATRPLAQHASEASHH